jgi:hypothetical protein
MHYKRVSTLEKALLFVAVYIQDGVDSHLSTRLFIDVLWVLQDGVRLSQLHKSKTVYVVDGVASRYK